MTSQTSSSASSEPDKAQLISNFHSVSESIVDSIRELTALAVKKNQQAAASPEAHRFVPPDGSQIIPHPRTIPDLLLRSAVIQLCAALAYALFLQVLRHALRRNRRKVTDLPGPRWLWPLLSVLIPELILVQISLWVICGFCPSVAEILGIERSQEPRSRLSRKAMLHPVKGAPLALLQALGLMVPLYFASKAYQQRMLMKYHDASFIANTGLDHRNGWAVASGLVCCSATLLLAGVLRANITQKSEEPVASHSGVSKHLEAIAEEDEEEVMNGHHSPPLSNHAKRRDPSTASQARSNAPTASSRSTGSARTSASAFLSDPEAILTLVLSSVVHQIPLAATNRLPPLTAVFTTRWSLLLIPIVLLSVLTLTHAERLALRRALLSPSTSDKIIVVYTILRTMAVIVPWLLVASTIFLQTWSDGSELRSLTHGFFQPWNYRWRVKDLFSHADADRVFMG